MNIKVLLETGSDCLIVYDAAVESNDEYAASEALDLIREVYRQLVERENELSADSYGAWKCDRYVTWLVDETNRRQGATLASVEFSAKEDWLISGCEDIGRHILSYLSLKDLRELQRVLKFANRTVRQSELAMKEGLCDGWLRHTKLPIPKEYFNGPFEILLSRVFGFSEQMIDSLQLCRLMVMDKNFLESTSLATKEVAADFVSRLEYRYSPIVNGMGVFRILEHMPLSDKPSHIPYQFIPFGLLEAYVGLKDVVALNFTCLNLEEFDGRPLAGHPTLREVTLMDNQLKKVYFKDVNLTFLDVSLNDINLFVFENSEIIDLKQPLEIIFKKCKMFNLSAKALSEPLTVTLNRSCGQQGFRYEYHRHEIHGISSVEWVLTFPEKNAQFLRLDFGKFRLKLLPEEITLEGKYPNLIFKNAPELKKVRVTGQSFGILEMGSEPSKIQLQRGEQRFPFPNRSSAEYGATYMIDHRTHMIEMAETPPLPIRDFNPFSRFYIQETLPNQGDFEPSLHGFCAQMAKGVLVLGMTCGILYLNMKILEWLGDGVLATGRDVVRL